MAKNKKSPSPENVSEMQAAMALILQREELRQRNAQKRVKRRRRKRRLEERKAVHTMQHSIEVIKWCIVAICTVWVISFLISIIVLIQVNSKVAEIEGQVDRIRHVMDNPFASAGARLGGQIDEKIQEFLRVPEQQDDEE